jgi:thioredoxin 1
MLKKIIPWVMFVLLFGLIIIGFALKENMNNYLSKMMKEQAAPETKASGAALIDSLYNYSKNGQSFEITFLEFGATGCSACKRMESVMEEINKKYPETVNVVFLNILKPESQILMKYFGVASIPTQVLLNKDGKEFFRHSGYISTEELETKFDLHKE